MINKKYIIGRIEKIKNISKIGEADRHNYRTKKYNLCGDSINNELTENNEHFEFFGFNTSAVETYKDYLKRLKRKPRKDHIMALELFFGYSPDSEISIDEFKNLVIEYMKKTFKDCPFSLDVHVDEPNGTPHIHCLVIPCKEKNGQLKFCASDWVGKKADLTKFQDDIYNDIGKPLGLSRGVKGSKAKHKKIQDYYEEQNKKQIEEFEKVKQENELIYQQMINEYNHKFEVLQQHTNSLDDEIDKYKYADSHNKLLEFQKMILEYIDTIEKEIQNSNDEFDIKIFKKCLDLLMTLFRKHKLIKDKQKNQDLEDNFQVFLF